MKSFLLKKKVLLCVWGVSILLSLSIYQKKCLKKVVIDHNNKNYIKIKCQSK